VSGLGARIVALDVHDVRFPTSRTLDGSDAMNERPDYSAAYVVLRTDGEHAGHGLAFTIGRGTEVVAAAARALERYVVGRTVAAVTDDMGGFWRQLTGDSQLRWLGPEKGAMHLATAAVVNAAWDLWARAEGRPLWRLVAAMEPERLVDCVPLRYLDDALTRQEAVDLLRRLAPTRAERIAALERDGYPAYTTSAGWLGYSDERIRALARNAVAAGWTELKMKVGADPAADRRRAAILREELGDENVLMMDANQVWGVREAIARTRELAAFDPLWIEEPTSPDDVLGHRAIAAAVAPVAVATGEHVPNRVMFKQLLQAGAIGYCQIDACRLGGVNEVLAVLLLAAKFGVPVCPHAGGVGLCEHVQHLALIDYVAVSGSLAGRRVEYVDHLHEHFTDPVSVRGGRYQAPAAPGYSTEMRPESVRAYAYPHGPAWVGESAA